MAFSKKDWCCGIICLWAMAACGGKSPPLGTLPANESNTPKQVMAAQELPRSKNISVPGQDSPESIAPGSCRLVGKIIAVLPDLEPDKSTPCGQVPCRAIVKIGQILGYGSAFGPPLHKNQEIQVYFNYTLSPTNKYFPELNSPLPGLKTGSVFQAEVRRAGDGAPEKAPWFQVYSYTLK